MTPLRKNICVLSDSDRSEIERAVRLNVPPYSPQTYAEFFAGCQKAAKEFPSGIYDWRDQARMSDWGLIQNLPLDSDLPATPTERNGADEILLFADGVIGSISTLFGTIFNIAGKARGRHIMNVYPVLGDEYTQLGSSKVELEWHVEEAFHRARPDWLALFCLRGDSNAVTKLARARDLQLPIGIITSLKEQHFKLRVDETYVGQTDSSLYTTTILSGRSENPEIILDPAYTVFEDTNQAQTLASVISAAENSRKEFKLTPGDLLIFNNRHVVHARSSFSPRMDGSDRWLKRMFILEDSSLVFQLHDGVLDYDCH